MKKKDYCYTTLLPLSVHYRQGSIHSSSFFFVSHSPLGVFSLLLLFPLDFSFFRRGARGDQKETGGCGRRSFHNPPCTASIFLASCLQRRVIFYGSRKHELSFVSHPFVVNVYFCLASFVLVMSICPSGNKISVMYTVEQRYHNTGWDYFLDWISIYCNYIDIKYPRESVALSFCQLSITVLYYSSDLSCYVGPLPIKCFTVWPR